MSKKYADSLPGQYLGKSNMIEQLQNDKIDVKILQKKIRASLWMMFDIDQECRDEKMTKK